MSSGYRITQKASDWRERLDKHASESASETPKLIAQIAQLVAELPPDQLLERAWGEEFRAFADVKDDTDIGHDEVVANKMVTYVQSVIVAVPRAPVQKATVSEDDWAALKALVSNLFGFHMRAFTMSLNTPANGEQLQSREAREAARIESSLVDLWYTVWGRRFPSHLHQYLDDLLLPHSAIFEELFGLTAVDLIRGLMKIENALRFGHAVTVRDLDELGLTPGVDSLVKLPQADCFAGSSAPEWVERAAHYLGWPTNEEDVHARIFELGLFDVSRNSQLPDQLLSELSWGPGEDDEFFSPGNLAGSPLRTWPIMRRPFLRLDGKFYCFDASALSDHIYRNLYHIVQRLRPGLAGAWRETQADRMEQLAANYFRRLLPGATVYSNAHYAGHGLAGEVDAIVIYDDHLIIVEAKGGAYAPQPPAIDFAAHIDSVKELGSGATNQGARFKKYLQAAPSVPIYDSNNKETRNKLADMSLSSFRHVSVCAVTLDQFTELAARLHHLTGMGITLEAPGHWLMSIDDMHVYADVFTNPLVFLHYVEQRTLAAQSANLDLDDELDHLGMYMEHSQYSAYAEDLYQERPFELAMFAGYRADIEHAFNERLREPTSTLALQQEMPERLREVLLVLAKSRQRGRARVASYLLDGSGETRKRVGEYIEQVLSEGHTGNRPRTFTADVGSDHVGLTLFCWNTVAAPRDAHWSHDYARTLVVMNGETERLLLELTYTPRGVLHQADWKWVRRDDIPKGDLPRFQAMADELRRGRKGATLRDQQSQDASHGQRRRQKIGRNAPCFCGSGKKYKRCCINLTPADPGPVRFVDWRR